jgi:protein KRI1
MSFLPGESDSSGDEQASLKINKKFAEKYESRERFKELQRAKELLEEDGGEDDSESETEDEDAEHLSASLDLQIVKTINSLRKKDPKVYDSTTKWFPENNGENSSAAASSGTEEEKVAGLNKKKKYKDVLREQLIKHGADFEEKEEHSLQQKKKGFSYDAEQESLRQQFMKSAASIDSGGDSSGSDDEGVVVPKKTSKQDSKTEVELQQALLEMKHLGEDTGEDGEAFLADFIINNRWKDKSSAKKKSQNKIDSDYDYDEEEQLLDKVDKFESKYNFRFEELQDSNEVGDNVFVERGQVQGHARNNTTGASLRRVDDKRKLAREARKERKEHERRQREAELRRLKNLKREEVSYLLCCSLVALTVVVLVRYCE